jgi:spore germination cell wall hydrolase CwlJ-like protein
MRVVANASRAWLLLTCLLAAGSGHALPMSHLDLSSEQAPPVSRDIFAETELYCLALGIFFEGGSTGEPDVGQRHIARVITERAKADRPYWGGKTICGVVFYKRKICQFSFACLPLARRTPRDNPRWRHSYAIAAETLEGRNEEPDSSIRYYMNEGLSNPKFACLFRARMNFSVKRARRSAPSSPRPIRTSASATRNR